MILSTFSNHFPTKTSFKKKSLQGCKNLIISGGSNVIYDANQLTSPGTFEKMKKFLIRCRGDESK